MPTLYIFPPGLDRPSLSPFCEKTMTWLALAGVAHTIKIGDPRRSPTGKLPVWRDDIALVADSGAILRHLIHRHGDPFDSALSPEQQAQGHLIRRLCEEHLYWVSVWLKWVWEPGWQATAPAVRKALPSMLAPVLLPILRRRPYKQLAGHGLGLHDDDEITLRAISDLDALEVLVGEGPFLFGRDPSSFDMVLHAFVSAITSVPGEHEILRHARSLPALGHLCDGIQERLPAA